MKRLVTVTVPVKTILTGEHFVVYGSKALVAASDLYTEVTISESDFSGVYITVNDSKIELSSDSLYRLQGLTQDIYQRWFLFCLRHIGTVLDREITNLSIKVATPVPPGSGMGHSASIIAGFLQGLSRYFNVSVSSQSYEYVVSHAEEFMHGNPSGVDQFAVLHGGVSQFQKGKNRSSIAIHPRLLQSFYVIFTGKPIVSTSSVVSHVSAFAKHNTAEFLQMLQRYSSLHESFVNALQDGDSELLCDLMNINQALLQRLGISTFHADRIVSQLQKKGFGCKITGAGTVGGDGVGMLLIHCLDSQSLISYCQKHALRVFPVTIGVSGVLD